MNKLFSWLFPRKFFFHSPINGLIKVIDEPNQPAIYAGGYPQSGRRYQATWENALNQTKLPKVDSIVLLGLAGGTALSILKKLYPSAGITIIEIDPVMIQVFKEHTHPVPTNITIIPADAIAWVHKHQSRRYQLILVDLYIGSKNPSTARETPFLRDLKSMGEKTHAIIFNAHFFPDKLPEYDLFIARCQKIFGKVLVLHENLRGRVLKLGAN
ncbi:hypothetical protein A3B57_00070 [Microgenomates group bacterium RIFCSPLOWO2_01_FULL_47_10]|nr:MAG: hypothetical protein A3B57_00070 [Microgenomates group bacterium RIFCSPLOWO2_01_FULL_47_10]